MKILHTSDWHLGITHQARSFTEDQNDFISKICDIITEKGVEAVMLCGDIYDRSNPSAEGVKLYDDATRRICKDMGKKLLVVAGNHDNSVRIGAHREMLSDSGLFTIGELAADLKPVELGNADIYMLPWISTERVKAVFPAEADSISSMTDAYKVVLDRIRAAFRPGRRHIVMAHAYIVDAETSVSDRSAEVGTAAAVSRDVFEGFDYVALGHIHKPQDIGNNIRYCGTPMKYSFGKEETQEKSVTIIDTDTMEREIVPIAPLRERTTITGSYEDIRTLKNVSEEQRKGYVRLQINDVYVSLDMAARLREVYPNILEYAGRLFEREDSSITIGMDELERLADDPAEIFRHFFADTMQCELDSHTMDLFNAAFDAYERSANE